MIGKKPSSPTLLRTALSLLPLQVLFRGGEAVLPLLLAAWFGRSAETDLYYLLAAYFVFAASLVTGAYQDSAVVPVLVEVGAHDPAQLPAVAGSLLGHTLLVGSTLAVGAGALASLLALLLPHPFHASVLASKLAVAMSLGLAATAVRAFYVGLMNARGRYSAQPIASGIGMAFGLLSIAWARRAFGVVAIPAGLFVGELLAIGLLVHWCARDGLPLTPNLKRPEPVRRIARLVRLEVAGSLITRINPVVDQAMSRLAGVVGGGSLLLYANQVASLPTSVLQATLFPVFLTRLSREAGRPRDLVRTTSRTLVSTTVVLVASAAVLGIFRAPVCQILFLHGAMDEEGARRIAEVLPWALLGVAPFGALLLLARAHVARQNSRIMPSMGILNATLNALLNLAFVGSLGLRGIALSTSVTYVVVAAVFWVRLVRRHSQ